MKGTLRVLGKELVELLDGWRGIALVLVLPAVLLLIVGQLRTDLLRFRLLIAGAAAPKASDNSSSKTQGFESVFDVVFGEFSALEVTRDPAPPLDPVRTMRERRFDMLLDVTCGKAKPCEDPKGWILYTATTDPARMASLERLARGIERSLRNLPEKPPTDWSGWMDHLTTVGDFPPVLLKAYYPQATQGSLFLLPMTIALTICFLPFSLSAATVIREVEARTLEILLATRNIGVVAVFTGKFLMAVVVTLLQFVIMLLLCQTVYGLNVKSGLLEMGAIVLPATAVSALMGLAVSAIVVSQAQAMLAAAIYFLALTTLSGFLFPITQGSFVIQALSSLLPLTFLQPALRAWMFGAGPLIISTEAAFWLVSQLCGYGALAILAYGRTLRRI